MGVVVVVVVAGMHGCKDLAKSRTQPHPGWELNS